MVNYYLVPMPPIRLLGGVVSVSCSSCSALMLLMCVAIIHVHGSDVNCGQQNTCPAGFPICCNTQSSRGGSRYGPACTKAGTRCCGDTACSNLNTTCCMPEQNAADNEWKCCESGKTCDAVHTGKCVEDMCSGATMGECSGRNGCSWCCSSSSCQSTALVLGNCEQGSIARVNNSTNETYCPDRCNNFDSCTSCESNVDGNGLSCGWCCSSQSCMSQTSQIETCSYYELVPDKNRCNACMTGGTGLYHVEQSSWWDFVLIALVPILACGLCAGLITGCCRRAAINLVRVGPLAHEEVPAVGDRSDDDELIQPLQTAFLDTPVEGRRTRLHEDVFRQSQRSDTRPRGGSDSGGRGRGAVRGDVYPAAVTESVIGAHANQIDVRRRVAKFGFGDMARLLERKPDDDGVRQITGGGSIVVDVVEPPRQHDDEDTRDERRDGEDGGSEISHHQSSNPGGDEETERLAGTRTSGGEESPDAPADASASRRRLPSILTLLITKTSPWAAEHDSSTAVSVDDDADDSEAAALQCPMCRQKCSEDDRLGSVKLATVLMLPCYHLVACHDCGKTFLGAAAADYARRCQALVNERRRTAVGRLGYYVRGVGHSVRAKGRGVVLWAMGWTGQKPSSRAPANESHRRHRGQGRSIAGGSGQRNYGTLNSPDNDARPTAVVGTQNGLNDGPDNSNNSEGSPNITRHEVPPSLHPVRRSEENINNNNHDDDGDANDSSSSVSTVVSVVLSEPVGCVACPVCGLQAQAVIDLRNIITTTGGYSV